ncbi:chloride channel protein [Ilumatobacter nonamiensis]|uniref:chloride channel protein n=1 Tax=Ilumatobacter nonamiensis TaxID=467093 RepID=UPI00130E4E34|nr:chloride channel protein [Ilumatobacter nonamiensis]
MPDPAVSPVDPQAVIRSREYIRFLLLSAVVGLAASLVAWCFLTLTPWIQQRVFEDLPDVIGFDGPPRWWPIPVLAVAGLVTALAITRLPGRGGSVPAEGMGSGPPTRYVDLPGVILAGLATLGLGLVLGPSAPVIAIGAGLGLLVLHAVQRDAPHQALMVMSAAGSCAAFAMVFRSPLVSAIVILEAIGLAGPLVPVVLLPCLIGAGVGSVVYLGLGYITGLSVDAYALYPLQLTAMGDLTVVQIAWTIPLAILAAAAAFLVVTGGRLVLRFVSPRPLLLLPVVGIAVAALAVLFTRTGETSYAVLFSGSKALVPVVDGAATIPAATLGWLLVLKGVAWSLSMGAFRGGGVFPAIFLGTVGGLLADRLPGLPQGAAVAIVLSAAVVSVMRLPLSSVVIATGLVSGAGAASATLVVISVVVAYIAVDKIFDRRGVDSRAVAEPVA